MGKVQIDSFLLSQWGYLEFIFIELFIDMSFTFHKTFVQIAEIDWLPGRQKGLMFEKNVKIPLLRNHKVDEADTLHTCL